MAAVLSIAMAQAEQLGRPVRLVVGYMDKQNQPFFLDGLLIGVTTPFRQRTWSS
jgi:hypothetical protein